MFTGFKCTNFTSCVKQYEGFDISLPRCVQEHLISTLLEVILLIYSEFALELSSISVSPNNVPCYILMYYG